MVFLLLNDFYMFGYFVFHWVLYICFLIISFCCMVKNYMIYELRCFLFDTGGFSCEWMSFLCHVSHRVLLFSLFLSNHFVAWLKRCFYFFLMLCFFIQWLNWPMILSLFSCCIIGMIYIWFRVKWVCFLSFVFKAFVGLYFMWYIKVFCLKLECYV